MNTESKGKREYFSISRNGLPSGHSAKGHGKPVSSLTNGVEGFPNLLKWRVFFFLSSFSYYCFCLAWFYCWSSSHKSEVCLQTNLSVQFLHFRKTLRIGKVSVDEIPSSKLGTTACSYIELLEMWSHEEVNIRIYRDTVFSCLTSMIRLYCKMIAYVVAETSNYLPISIFPFSLSNFTLWFLTRLMAPHHKDYISQQPSQIDMAMWLNSDQWTIRKLWMQF